MLPGRDFIPFGLIDYDNYAVRPMSGRKSTLGKDPSNTR